jgi:hypothetical protein
MRHDPADSAGADNQDFSSVTHVLPPPVALFLLNNSIACLGPLPPLWQAASYEKFYRKTQTFFNDCLKIIPVSCKLEHFSAARALYTKYSAGCLPVRCCASSRENGPGKLLHRTSASYGNKMLSPGFYFRHLCHLLAGVRKFRSSLKDGMERCSKETEND